MSLDIQSKFLRYSPRDGRTINNKFYLFQRLHLDPWLLLFISITSFLGLITLYNFEWHLVSFFEFWFTPLQFLIGFYGFWVRVRIVM